MPLSPAAAGINRALVRSVLTQRATVYSRTGGTGPYNLVVKSGLACRLEAVAALTAPATNAERREQANLGSFRWDAEYELPETGVQIEVDAFPGKRWNPVAATAWPDDVPGIGVVGRTCQVTRAL